MSSDKIPRRALEEWICLCLDKAKALADDAMRLLKKGGLVEHVAVLYVYAIEEYGKALLLNDEAEANAERATVTLVTLDKGVFYGKSAHTQKLARAHKVLPVECLEFTGEAAFDFRNFSRNDFQVGVPADLETRTEALYIDWDQEKKNWGRFPPINKKRLKHAIELFQAVLKHSKIQGLPKDSKSALS